MAGFGACLMSREIGAEPSGTLPLTSTVFRISRHRVIIGRVSARLTGRRKRSVRLSFLPKDPAKSGGLGTIELDLSRAQAMALGEWIIEQAIKRAPTISKP